MDFIASAMASTGGPWQPCHTADVIGLLLALAALAGAMIGYCVGRYCNEN